MSSLKTDLDNMIQAVSQSLRDTLADCIVAYRDGDFRATFNTPHDLALERQQLMITADYLTEDGRPGRRYSDFSILPSTKDIWDVLVQSYQVLVAERVRFSQAGEDTKTTAKSSWVQKVRSILSLELDGLLQDEFGTTDPFSPAGDTSSDNTTGIVELGGGPPRWEY